MLWTTPRTASSEMKRSTVREVEASHPGEKAQGVPRHRGVTGKPNHGEAWLGLILFSGAKQLSWGRWPVSQQGLA